MFKEKKCHGNIWMRLFAMVTIRMMRLQRRWTVKDVLFNWEEEFCNEDGY